MCGIIGCVSNEAVAPILLQGLKHLEYRGYDSAGAATIDSARIVVRKGAGKVNEIERKHRISSLPGSTGLAHCLHPDTLVQMSDGGVTRIEDLPETCEVVSVDTDTLKVGTAKATKFRHRSPPFLLRVRTGSSSLLCSESHKMFVSRDGEIMECAANEINKDDLLIRPKAFGIAGASAHLLPVPIKRYVVVGPVARSMIKEAVKRSKQTRLELAHLAGISSSYLDHVLRGDRSVRKEVIDELQEVLSVNLDTDIKPVSHSHGKPVTLPEATSPALIQLVAYILGDGHVYPRMVRIKDADPQLISHYAGLFSEIFGISARVKKLREARAYALLASSTALSRWLVLNFTRDTGEFIASVGRMTDAEVASFIQGIFDAEGTVSLKSKQILIRMTDERLIRTLQFLMLRFGIQSSFGVHKRQKRNWKTAFSLSISDKEDTIKFLEVIGTASVAKREKITRIIAPRKGLAFSKITVPLPKETLRQAASGLGIGKYLKGGKFLDQLTVAKIWQQARERTNVGGSQLVTLLRRYLEGEILFERVKAVTKEPSDTPFLYDLEVAGTHSFVANCLVSHNSRWATHGGVTDRNAHPQTSCREGVAIVHNGIIENYVELRKDLRSKGHVFKSETDSEVIAHLIEQEYKKLNDPTRATISAAKELIGQYAFAAIFQDRPGVITGARKDAPLLIGVAEGKKFIASDVLAFIEHTDRTIFLDNLEVAEVTRDSVRIFKLNGKEVKRKPTQVAWELSDLSKLDYAHYTLKEIHEQPRTVINAGLQNEERLEEFLTSIERARSVFITGAGSSYHAGLILKHGLNRDGKLRPDAILAGEFKEHLQFVDGNSVVIVLSQSGETADVLEAVRGAKGKGAKIVSIVNAAGSTLARESEVTLLLNCGPEIGVAATKSFTAQVVVCNLIVDRLGDRKNGTKPSELGRLVEESLGAEPAIKRLASQYKDRPDFYFVARGLHYPVAMEGALKLKELAYIHAEGMPASELKHGTLALIEKGTPVVVINPEGETHSDTLSNAEELKARGAVIIGISDKSSDVYTHFVKIPTSSAKILPILEVIPLQLLAYYAAVERRNDPDYPRNLAKSVTVK